MIDPRSEYELVGGGDTLLHYHLADRATNAGLQKDARVVQVSSSTYSATFADDFIVLDTSLSAITVTLPLSRNGREIEIILNVGPNKVTVLPQSGETIMGSADAVLTTVGTAIRFKAIGTNWTAI